MLVSSTSMKAAKATTTAISHGLNLGFQGSADAEGGAPPAPESPGLELEDSFSSSAIDSFREYAAADRAFIGVYFLEKSKRKD